MSASPGGPAIFERTFDGDGKRNGSSVLQVLAVDGEVLPSNEVRIGANPDNDGERRKRKKQ